MSGPRPAAHLLLAVLAAEAGRAQTAEGAVLARLAAGTVLAQAGPARVQLVLTAGAEESLQTLALDPGAEVAADAAVQARLAQTAVRGLLAVLPVHACNKGGGASSAGSCGWNGKFLRVRVATKD